VSLTTVTWTGDRLQFVGEPGYGGSLLLGGDAEGPGAKPSDLLPISLATCTAYDVVVILGKQRQDLQGMRIVTESVQDPDPPFTFRSIHMHFVFSGPIDERKAARAVELSESKYCGVAASLRATVRITHSVEIAG
jgi:putative redox protein